MAALKSIRDGDIVEVDHSFHAIVTGKEGRRLKIKPILRSIGRYSCTGAQVTKHWRLTKNTPKPKARKDDDRT
jgi:hypothetical protein